MTVVNFFASWCMPCRQEAPILPELAKLKGVALYGVAYKDMPDKARQFLNEVGNPFERIGLDAARQRRNRMGHHRRAGNLRHRRQGHRACCVIRAR